LYDPLGLAAPVTIRGKFLLRDMTSRLKERQLNEWDQPLPKELTPNNWCDWNNWCDSITNLQQLHVPRAYSTTPMEEAKCELHIFCDASTRGIAAVAYSKVIQSEGRFEI
jgi:hypothetical protein